MKLKTILFAAFIIGNLFYLSLLTYVCVTGVTLDTLTSSHKCIDNTHTICDDSCECDGLECSK
jgi:hypothetical protein